MAHGTTVVAHHGQLDPGHRSAHGGGDDVVGITGSGTGPERRLGGRVTDHHRTAQPSPHVPDEFGRNPRRTGTGDPQMRQVGLLEIGMGQHERPLGGDPLPDGHPFLHQQGDGGGGRPRLRRDHGGDAVGDLVPGAGHVADVGEGQRGEPAIAGMGEHVGAGGHGGQVGMVEDRSFGDTGRAARPHDGDRIPGRQGGEARGGGSGRLGQGGTGHEVAGAGGNGSVGHEVGVHHRHHRSRPGDDRRLLGRAQAEVEARRHRPEAGRRLVADGVVDRRRQQKADHIALGHAPGGQQSGDPIGGGVPLGEGEPPAAVGAGRDHPHRPGLGHLDIRLDLGIHVGGDAQNIDHGGHRPADLTHRHKTADGNRGAWTRRPPGAPEAASGAPLMSTPAATSWRSRSAQS